MLLLSLHQDFKMIWATSDIRQLELCLSLTWRCTSVLSFSVQLVFLCVEAVWEPSSAFTVKHHIHTHIHMYICLYICWFTCFYYINPGSCSANQTLPNTAVMSWSCFLFRYPFQFTSGVPPSFLFLWKRDCAALWWPRVKQQLNATCCLMRTVTWT